MLSGVLALYGLFIFVQIERLWVNDLPVDFASTENLVKTGFWQLVFLSFLNSALFVFFLPKDRAIRTDITDRLRRLVPVNFVVRGTKNVALCDVLRLQL